MVRTRIRFLNVVRVGHSARARVLLGPLPDGELRPGHDSRNRAYVRTPPADRGRRLRLAVTAGTITAVSAPTRVVGR
jgi:hypothetical protein